MLRRLELGAVGLRRAGRARAPRAASSSSRRRSTRLSAGVLDEIGVPAFKVGSGELTNLPFLVNLAARGRPLIVSTGMATMDEVADAVQAVGGTPLGAAALRVELSGAGRGGAAAGAATCWWRPSACPSAGRITASRTTWRSRRWRAAPCIVEAHLTLDRTLPGPITRCRSNPTTLRSLISRIRLVESALGDGVKRPQPSELNTAERRPPLAGGGARPGRGHAGDRARRSPPSGRAAGSRPRGCSSSRAGRCPGRCARTSR